MTGSKSGSERSARRVVLTWLCMTLLAVLRHSGAGDRMRRGVFDSWQSAKPARPFGNRRPRRHDRRSQHRKVRAMAMAALLSRAADRRTAQRGAKVIAFDILFPEHDRARARNLRFALSGARAPPPLPRSRHCSRWTRCSARSSAVAGGPCPCRRRPRLRRASCRWPMRPSTGKLPAAVDSWPAELAAIPELDDVALGSGLINARPDSRWRHPQRTAGDAGRRQAAAGLCAWRSLAMRSAPSASK